MNRIIGADHEFHDQDFVSGWADRFVPTPERLQLFNIILSELKANIPADSNVIELGLGPGYLADYLLEALPDIQYFGIDFSRPMLDIAQQRLQTYAERIVYVEADLLNDHWWTNVPDSVNAIVSTWSLHDLGSQKNIERVYGHCTQVLHNSGVLLNGDFIKPDSAIYDYEPGRFEVSKHIEALGAAGFKNSECLAMFEMEIESPTASQNYACLKGVL